MHLETVATLETVARWCLSGVPHAMHIPACVPKYVRSQPFHVPSSHNAHTIMRPKTRPITTISYTDAGPGKTLWNPTCNKRAWIPGGMGGPVNTKKHNRWWGGALHFFWAS